MVWSLGCCILAAWPCGLYQHVAMPALLPPAMSEPRLSPTMTAADRSGSPSASNVRSNIAVPGFAAPTSAEMVMTSKCSSMPSRLIRARWISLSPFVISASVATSARASSMAYTPGYSSP